MTHTPPNDMGLSEFHERVHVTLLSPPQPIAYSIKDAAAAVGVSEALLRGQIAHGYLIARYVTNTKLVVEADELRAWLHQTAVCPEESTMTFAVRRIEGRAAD